MMDLHDFQEILEYIYRNQRKILFINFSGIWDIFLHKDINIYFLRFLEKFEGTWIHVLIPTKGQSVSDSHLDLLRKFRSYGVNLNISIGLYSIREDIYNKLSWSSTFTKTIRFIKRLKHYNINFSIELLINKFSIHEKQYFIDFCNSLGAWYTFQNYHNFVEASVLNNDHDIICSFDDNDDYRLPDNFCSFIPFVDCRWDIYTCSISWKKNRFLVWHHRDLFQKYSEYNNLVKHISDTYVLAENCSDCSIYKSYESKNINRSHSIKSV